MPRLRPSRHAGPDPACVLGDVDLVRALGLAGIPSLVVAAPDEPARFSRHAAGGIDALDHWTEQDAYVARLMALARRQPAPPVLLYQADGDLLMVSRHRERLADGFRFVIADAELVEDLVDKARFAALAERLSLPVPAGTRVRPAEEEPHTGGLRYPLIAKPLLRRSLQLIERQAKALRVEDEAALRALWPGWAASAAEVMLQELVRGTEARIESYHCYVDAAGSVAGEFTGRKIRTHPAAYGHTTALEITDAPEVAALGRDLIGRLQLTGVAKLDFKRAPDGRLWLLEVNPRFSLWHLPGAVAGVNLPALVYADLTGAPRPAATRARAGVTWCEPWADRWARAEHGVPLATWLAWVARCDTRHGAALGDPLPFVRGTFVPAVRERLGR